MADIRITGRPTTGIDPGFLQAVLAAARAQGATSINITSGYRDPSYNAKVGGATDSNHMRGLAMDATVTIPGQGTIPIGNLPNLAQYGIRSGATDPTFFNGRPDPVHVDAGYRATSFTPPGGAQAPYMGQQMNVVDLIRQLSPGYNLDPQAALAVASVEGLSGRVGDQGTSFGPFQLHYGGAYPGFAPRGQAASQAWASSLPGISYALQQMSQHARGLKGPAAIRAIVSQFERPADVPGEIAAATRAYGTSPAGYPVSGGGTGGMTGAAAGGLTPFPVVTQLPKFGQIDFTQAINQVMRQQTPPPLLKPLPAITTAAPTMQGVDVKPPGDYGFANIVKATQFQ